MVNEAFTSLASKVLLRCPSASSFLARDWIKYAFRQIAERRRWSWLIKQGQFIANQDYTTGTASAVRYSTTITGSGTTWTPEMVGRQFRIGSIAPIYTIAQWNSATSINIDLPWAGVTISGAGYEIYNAYFTPPSDFHSFLTIWDPNFNWQLWKNHTQEELNTWDAQRSNSGNAYLVAARDYTTSSTGIVGPVTQAHGSGPAPISTGSYTGAAAATFVVEITTGGAPGTAVYEWKKDAGNYTTGVLTDSTGAAQELQDSVQIYFPTGVTYHVGDVFTFVVAVADGPGIPRYELWPHQKTAYNYPFLYEARCQDLDEPGAVLPRFIRSDVVLENALAQAARWPGTKESPNPYFNLNLWKSHNDMYERAALELERQDDEVMNQDLTYVMNQPFAPFPFDAAWIQSHSV